MPGWHEKTKQLVAEKKLAVAGIVQEQHPDRAVLFRQWKMLDWPVFSDPFNDLGVAAVPITLLIDEHGIIRYRNPKEEDLQAFLATEYRADAKEQSLTLLPKSLNRLKELISKEPDNARAHFRLGVAYRMRFDSNKRDPNDFAKAMAHWQKALALNPNQYIWRRRIQQYGPRLDKPYSFYDWVTEARKELINRGWEPAKLVAEPSGAEFARPSKKRGRESALANHPDPKNQVDRDQEKLITCQVVVVPSTNPKAQAVRIHLTFVPALTTTWTNDAGNMSFHLNPDIAAEIVDLKIPALPKEISSSETRVIEFALHPKKGQPLPKRLTGAAFYYVCTKTDQTCRYLRNDLVIELNQ